MPWGDHTGEALPGPQNGAQGRAESRTIMADYNERGGTGAWRRTREHFARALPLPCSVCGLPVRPDQPWHLDHVVPRAKGGKGGAVWPAHKRCNLSKKDRQYTAAIYVDPAGEL